ncbi:fructosamine kinase family protein [Methyloceanibacter caenitepidi]|uniref:Ribulosamine/erythrulosamine 3-kinase n=1 Tax=Methyloceanibacter caenitepidi TaxID=1384459 RepID=A0A0A8K522_9HYPH|nr:fructosamine kinase family protein [Methyloceanibacter caenitepidi]BAQ17109.1 ribulosamine/erythrulosamine 3-kinase [Methyloceanibacter caenitepidi]
MDDPEALLNHRLDTILGASVVSRARLSAGFGLTGIMATLSDGRRVAVKARASESVPGPSLALEGAMLADLARLSDLPVPHVYAAEADLLVMDFIDNDGGSITPAVERHAATLIAALHAIPRDQFGYDYDTLIGPLHQPNPPSDTWLPFFRDHRLLHMAQAARDEGALPHPLYGRLERLAGRLGEYLAEPSHPSLLHGDLWTGNVLVRGDRIAGFVDPAIYCGHPEIELAFTTMFGTFGRAFFDAYEEILPLEPGFHEVRRDTYNLYPTLVHVRLFGGSYVAAVERTLAKLGV